MKKFIILFIFLLLIGCSNNSDDITIGGVFHLSGPGSFWGSAEHNGALLAVEEINQNGGINGKQLNLIVEDGKTDLLITVSSIKKLISINGVQVIIGPTWFGQVAAPIAEDMKTVILSPSTGVTVERQKYFFNLWPTERQEIIPLVDYLKDQQDKIAIIYGQNDWSISIKDNFVDEAKKYDLEIIEEYSFLPDESDFRTIIAKLKNENVSAVYGAFAFYPSQGKFTKQLKESGLNISVYSTSGTENPELLNAYPIEGTIYPHPLISIKEKEFLEKYEQKYDVKPAPSVAYAYDAVYLIAAALRNGLNSNEITAYLEDVNYSGVSNSNIKFVDGRVFEKEYIIKVVKNGEFQEVLN